jgi:hypothetical protein
VPGRKRPPSLARPARGDTAADGDGLVNFVSDED